MADKKQVAERVPMASADIDESDVKAVADVVRSGRLALGPKVLEFEKTVAQYAGTKHAIAVSSGTSGLHLIVKAMGIGRGDEVLVPSFTFAASVNAFLFEGAVPVFVDIEPETFNLDTKDLERKITSRTKAIVVVDAFGHPAEWKEILRISRKHRLKVIDDSCEALGARYDGKPVGKFGDAATFAFYPNKQITTGEGGIIVTDNDEIARLARSYRNQGRDEMGHWLEHVRLGFNYRMDEMSAALGISQMRRLEQFIEKRARVASWYNELLSKHSWLKTPKELPGSRMSWFVYVVTLAKDVPVDAVIQSLSEEGIPSRAYFSPIHKQKYIRELFPSGKWHLPVTDELEGRTLALPFHNNLSRAEVELVVKTLESVVSQVRGRTYRKAA